MGHGRRAASSSRRASRRAACDATTRCWTDRNRWENRDAGCAPNAASKAAAAPSALDTPAGRKACCSARPGRRASSCRGSTCTCRTPRRGSRCRRHTASSAGAPATRRRVCWTTAIGASVRALAVRRLPRPRLPRGRRLRRFVRLVQVLKGVLGGLEIAARLELRVKIDGVDDGFRGLVDGVRRLY